MDTSLNPQFFIEFGDRVKQSRLSANMTQDELAERLGYKHKTSISKIEKGKAAVQQSMVVQIASVLGVSVQYLMGTDKGSSPKISLKKNKEKFITNNNQALLDAWAKATDEDKFAVYAILRKYGMPQPQEEDTVVLSESSAAV